MNASFDEPTIPHWLRRPLTALWISLGLHAAVVAWVQVAPPAAAHSGGAVIEARLVGPHAISSATNAADQVSETPLLAPTETADALPVAQTVAPPLAEASAPISPALSAPSAAVEAAPAPVSPLAITSSVDLTYYSAREVDVHPRAMRAIEPDYPVAADRQKLSGTVYLQLKVEADGRVGEVEVVSSTPPGMFDESAIQAFRSARFEPAIRNGRPVRALVVIEVRYDWTGRPDTSLGTGLSE